MNRKYHYLIPLVGVVLFVSLSTCIIIRGCKHNNVEELLRQGNVYATEGDWEKAIESYEEAVRLKPNNADARFILGAIYAAKGDKRATASLLKAAQLYPGGAKEVSENMSKLLTRDPADEEQEEIEYTVCEPEEAAKSKHLFPVPINGKWGYMNETGKVVVRPQFNYAWEFSDGLGRVRIFGRGEAFVDKTGKVVIQPKFFEAADFAEGLAIVNGGNLFVDKYGYMNKAGETAIKPQFDHASPFGASIKGLAYVTVGNESFYIDKTGKKVYPKQEKFVKIVGYPKRFWENGKFGYMNNKGEIIVEPRFDDADRSFSEGMARVNIGKKLRLGKGHQLVGNEGKWGYINDKGQLVVKPQFDEAEPFKNGLARVGIGFRDKIGYIDKTGKYIWKPTKR